MGENYKHLFDNASKRIARLETENARLQIERDENIKAWRTLGTQVYEESIEHVAGRLLRKKTREIEQLRKFVEELRSIPFDRGPDGEPGPPSLSAYVDLQARAVALEEALSELVEVASLRGDNELGNPEDDPVLWTSRMQDAWDEAEWLAVVHDER